MEATGSLGRGDFMHKDTRWAQQIISMQEKDGKWGFFHTPSGSSRRPITTEQALRRLERLGYTIEDICIQKACSSCWTGGGPGPQGKDFGLGDFRFPYAYSMEQKIFGWISGGQ